MVDRKDVFESHAGGRRRRILRPSAPSKQAGEPCGLGTFPRKEAVLLGREKGLSVGGGSWPVVVPPGRARRRSPIGAASSDWAIRRHPSDLRTPSDFRIDARAKDNPGTRSPFANTLPPRVVQDFESVGCLRIAVARTLERKGVFGSHAGGRRRRILRPSAPPRQAGEPCGLGTFPRKEAVVLGRERFFRWGV